ncbi:MAG: hypothetical protein IPK73_23720 [Candidatus Obscuribacter sp.]|nr:hypothetical protein [Candidatus Obscuribacter sp.]
MPVQRDLGKTILLPVSCQFVLSFLMISPAISKDEVVDLTGPIKMWRDREKIVNLEQGDMIILKLPDAVRQTRYGKSFFESRIKGAQQALLDLDDDRYVAARPGEACVIVYQSGSGFIHEDCAIRVIVKGTSVAQKKALLGRVGTFKYGKQILALAQIAESDSPISVQEKIGNLESLAKNQMLSKDERQLALLKLQSLGPEFSRWLAAHPLSAHLYLRSTLERICCSDAGPIIRVNISKAMAMRKGFERRRLVQEYANALAGLEGQKCIPSLYPLTKDAQKDLREAVLGIIKDLTMEDYYRRSPIKSQSWEEWWQLHSRHYVL